MYLTVGDKVRLIKTREAGEIREVFDEEHALVEFFDQTVKVHIEEVTIFSLNNKDEHVSRFVPKHTPVSKSPTKELVIDELVCHIDLHAESLGIDSINRSSEEILSIQLSRLSTFINQSLHKGCKEITIIHGKGSGRLKAEVQTILRHHEDVRHFSKNDQGVDKGQTIASLS